MISKKTLGRLAMTHETPGQYTVEVYQRDKDTFAVKYGEQVKAGLSREEAITEFGECCFHAAACNDLFETRHTKEQT